MATSTAPAFMNALHDALSARAALAGVRVNYGPALPDPGRESVNILGMSGDWTIAEPQNHKQTNKRPDKAEEEV